MKAARVRVALLAAPVLALAVVSGSVALACTNLATMTLSSGNGHVGDNIVLTGTSFPVPRATSNTPPTPVVVRWQAVDGPILGTVVPDRTGTISLSFTVPQANAGNVVILGIQKRAVVNPDNPDATPTAYVDEPGTPARATFRVLAQGEVAPPRVSAADFVVTTGAGKGNTALIVLMVVFGAVAMSLFAGGVIAFLHQVRARSIAAEMAAEPWRHWS